MTALALTPVQPDESDVNTAVEALPHVKNDLAEHADSVIRLMVADDPEQTLNDWTFDHSGWNPEPQLVAVNTDFEGHRLERVAITVDLAAFCEQHYHRMPHHYWRDPMQRARDYVGRHKPPWV